MIITNWNKEQPKTQEWGLLRPNMYIASHRSEVAQAICTRLIRNGRVVYETGNIYPIEDEYRNILESDRGVKLINIREEDARFINAHDAQAAGFGDEYEFLDWWIRRHDAETFNILSKTDGSIVYPLHYKHNQEYLRNLGYASYRAYALTFEVVQSDIHYRSSIEITSEEQE